MLVAVTNLDGDAVLPLAEAKDHLRILDNDQDDVIGLYRTAALSWVERYCGVSLQSRDWTWAIDGFGGVLRPPVSPVTAIGEVTYRDTTGTVVTINAADYRYAGGVLSAARLWPATDGSRGGVTVTLTAGFTDAAEQAPELIQAAKLMLGHFFANRSAVTVGVAASEVPLAVPMLCASHLQPGIA